MLQSASAVCLGVREARFMTLAAWSGLLRHSERNACMRSAETARQAETTDAANARSKSKNAAPANTTIT